MANFDFPPHLSISLAAKDLINRLLHPDPEKRPRIPEIREHSYFTGKPLASLSTAMPNSANSTAAAADNRQLPSSGGSGLIMSVKMATERILSNYSGQGIDIERKRSLAIICVHLWSFLVCCVFLCVLVCLFPVSCFIVSCFIASVPFFLSSFFPVSCRN